MMRVPQFEDSDVTKFLVEWMRDVDRQNGRKMDSDTANRALLLYSPSKKVYEITVTDAGVLVATKVAG